MKSIKILNIKFMKPHIFCIYIYIYITTVYTIYICTYMYLHKRIYIFILQVLVMCTLCQQFRAIDLFVIYNENILCVCAFASFFFLPHHSHFLILFIILPKIKLKKLNIMMVFISKLY